MLTTKQKVDRLERIFGQYMTQTNAIMKHLDEMMADMKQQAELAERKQEQDRQEADRKWELYRQEKQEADREWELYRQEKQEADRKWELYRQEKQEADRKREQDRQEADREREQDRQEAELKWERHRLEEERKWEQDRLEAELKWERHRLEEERKWEQDRLEADRKWERDRKEWNKRWGELSNRLGTIAEDIVAPNMPRIAQEYFKCGEVDDLMVRRWIRNKKDRSKRREFDAIVVAGDTVIVNETKATPKIEYIDRFLEMLPEFTEYFPEYEGKTLIPVFSSLYMQDDIVNYLTKHHVYAMVMGDETMEIVNFQDVSEYQPG